MRSEREWASDKRDFVADRREGIADERETEADAREVAADERDRCSDARERELDGRERHLERRAGELRLPSPSTAHAAHATEQRTRDDDARGEDAEKRRDGQKARTVTANERREATERREAAMPPTGLAMAFADIATHFYECANIGEVLETIAGAAVSTLSSCDMASITARDGDGFRTLASTHSAATDVDKAQYRVNEGPCLDATEATSVYAEEFPDARWPALASEPKALGVHSIASFRVATSQRETAEGFVGSLNAYSGETRAFDLLGREMGLILAAHASTALRAVGERVTLEDQAEQLQKALDTRDVIGQATGILMERLRATPEEAFDILRRASQNLNIKLRLVAESLTETGELKSKAE